MDNKTRRDKVRHVLKVMETKDECDVPYTLLVCQVCLRRNSKKRISLGSSVFAFCSKGKN